jgi:hypothetical protein
MSNRYRVDILGFDVAGKLSDDIVKNTTMANNTVMAYPTYTICVNIVLLIKGIRSRTICEVYEMFAM